MFSLSDYRFSLPENLIAETASHPAHNAKLMIINKKSWEIISEDSFWNIDKFLGPNAVLFFNNSRVVRARIPLHETKFITMENHEGIIKSGEIFFLKHLQNNTFEALVRPGKKFKIGTKIFFENFVFEIIDNTQTGRVIAISGGNIDTCMEYFGELPLPPYIEYSKEKEKDYQNVFAQKSGSVAAPTASLHFTQELLDKLPQEKHFITLHIGLGTFKTIDTEDIRNYNIHSETAEVSKEIFSQIFAQKTHKKTIIAVGTTACRTLESLPSLWKNLDENTKKLFSQEVQDFWNTLSQNAEKNWITSYSFDGENMYFATQAYITPGYTFLVIDELITNFHLPESSLLVLVSALIWQQKLLENYHYAIEKKYRFFSFGDGMYIKQ